MTEFETSEQILAAIGGMEKILTAYKAEKVTRHPDGLSFVQKTKKFSKTRQIRFLSGMNKFSLKTITTLIEDNGEKAEFEVVMNKEDLIRILASAEYSVLKGEAALIK